MTIQRARDLLGEEVKDLSDLELLEYIKAASKFCKALLEIIQHDIVSNQ